MTKLIRIYEIQPHSKFNYHNESDKSVVIEVKETGDSIVTTSPRIDESGDISDVCLKLGKAVDGKPFINIIEWGAVLREAKANWEAKAHQSGIDEAETQTLQEIMDDLTLLHKRKEIDDNGFCTVRDLLHIKALQDNK